ncbi:MAG: hypothetical protein EA350_12720, partial [Gemmatimonadales bacterium]
MANVERSSADTGPGESVDPVLRAKYLDFCSARVAEALLSLSPDEMFLLAEDAAREASTPHPVPLGYEDMVRLATERLSRRIDLPSFAAFREAYRKDPTSFDREMLGLWESDPAARDAAARDAAARDASALDAAARDP